MKIFSNTKFKKFLAVFLVVIVLFNVVSPSFMTPKVYADSDSGGGILAWPIAKLLKWLSIGLQSLMNVCFGLDTSSGDANLFISSIVYGKIDVFDVNIFSTETLNGTDRAEALLNNEVTGIIAKYYGFTRTLAIASSLIILIYVGIRILTSTAAGDLTKYKSLLKDWLMSLVLVLMMHYIMSATLFVCDELTTMFANLGTQFVSEATGVTSVDGYDFYEVLNTKIEGDSNNMDVITYSIIKIAFMFMTGIFVLIYAKRTIMIAFLTIVGPLVGISYSIDKIKDGQSQILDKWTKEYIYEALTMPLDALLFSIVSSMLISILNATDVNIILALALIIGYVPLRTWFTEFIGADKAGHTMKAVAAGAVAGKLMDGDKQINKRKGNNGTSNEKGGSTDGAGGALGGAGGAGGALGGAAGGALGGAGGAAGGALGGAGGAAGGAAGGVLGSFGGERGSGEASSYGSAGGTDGGKGKLGKGIEGLKEAASGGTKSLSSYAGKKAVEAGGKIAKKAGRGALNMTENAAARAAGLAKGALAGTAAMLITGNGGLALQRGISGYRHGTESAVGKMDSIEKGAKNAAIGTAVVAGTLKDSMMGNDDKRTNLMNESENGITNDYNSQIGEYDANIAADDEKIKGYNSEISSYNSDINGYDESMKELNSDSEFESNRANQLQSYSSMTADQFDNLDDDSRQLALNDARQTLGDDYYDTIMDGFSDDKKEGEKLLFQNAQDLDFKGAKDDNANRRAEILHEKLNISHAKERTVADRDAANTARTAVIKDRIQSVKAKQNLESNKDRDIEGNREQYSNMSRANVNRQYRSEVKKAKAEGGSKAKRERKAQLKKEN